MRFFVSRSIFLDRKRIFINGFTPRGRSDRTSLRHSFDMKTTKFIRNALPKFKQLVSFAALILGLSGVHSLAQTCVAPPSGLVAWWQGEGNAYDFISGSNGMAV